MKFMYGYSKNPEIEILNIIGDLTGGGAIKLKEHLYLSLDKGKCCILLNLKSVENIDGLGIKVICDMVNRGMQIGLFNVNADIRMMFKMDRKEGIVKVYNGIDSEKVINSFEKDISIGKRKSQKLPKKRCHCRIKTDFPVEFKYFLSDTSVVLGKGRVINLSEGGMFANEILAFNTMGDEEIYNHTILEKDLHEIIFKLNSGPDIIEISGKCVREFRCEGILSAGILFEQMKQSDRNLIKEYVKRKVENM